jgi:SpoVK/Ycf46/Vps4 family AAA+-type ATPase
MSTTKKLADIFRALAVDDLSAAKSAARELCRLEEEKGHRTVARLLRGSLTASARGASVREESLISRNDNSFGVLSTGLVQLKDKRDLAEIQLTDKNRTELEHIVLEWKFGAALRKRGISPRSKLLFHGPPGCGKSLTAQALGRALEMPVFMVRFDAVIGAFLGQTAIHLRQLFHFAETTPCVLLLDELDALGKQRGNPLDVGELDRIVISLMQELEHSKPLGVIVGTTNLPKHLDNALWRRFDIDIEFKAPTRLALRAFAKKLAKDKLVSLNAHVMARIEKAPSFAAAESIVAAEVRRATLIQIGAK